MASPVLPSGSTPTTVPETPAEVEKGEYRPGSLEAQLNDTLQDLARCEHLSYNMHTYERCAQENDLPHFQNFFGSAAQWIEENIASAETLAVAGDLLRTVNPGLGVVADITAGLMTFVKSDNKSLHLSFKILNPSLSMTVPPLGSRIEEPSNDIKLHQDGIFQDRISPSEIAGKASIKYFIHVDLMDFFRNSNDQRK